MINEPIRISIDFIPLGAAKQWHGLSETDDDVSFRVFINSSVCSLIQRQTIGHELAHVFLGHLRNHGCTVMNRDDPMVKELEHEARFRSWEFYRRYRDGEFDECIVSRHIVTAEEMAAAASNCGLGV